MSTALVFEQPSPASTALVFGAGGDIARVDIAVTGSLPALTARILLFPPVDIELTGTIPGLVLLAAISYDSNTARPTVAQIHDAAQVAGKTECGVTQPQQHAQPTSTGCKAPAQDAQALSAALSARYQQAQEQTQKLSADFKEGTSSRTSTGASMQDGDAQWRRFYSQFQEADRLAAKRLGGRFEDGLHDRRPKVQGNFQEATRRDALQYRATAKPAVHVVFGRLSKTQKAMRPPAGQYVWPPIPGVVPPYWGTDLVFAFPPLSHPDLVFGELPPSAPIYILPARFYMTAHSIYAQRLPDLEYIPIFEATVSADSGSYCWSLTASGPASLFELLAPVDGLPAQMRLTLDGMPWVFAVDALSRSATFGKTGVTVQGRSVTALIAAPYVRSEQRVEPDAKTAQQIALANLSGTGIDLDWGIGEGALSNGGLIDWLVPAGAYSRQGTALDSVQRIVQAAGGYLQSHRSDPTLQARHPYGQRAGDVSGAPWAWGLGAADVELAPDALITEGIQRQDGPDINAVYVSGTSHGLLALVKRAGTAGDKLSAMLTDSLITHTAAARQAGLAILGAAGHKYAVSLTLPVLSGSGQPGVLSVGQLVQVNASVPWRGRVRAVSVNAKQPTLRQTLTLERHLETA